MDLAVLAERRRQFAGLGLAVPALQAILFGRPDCTLFGDETARAKLKAHLEFVARIAGVLGARACVFGSPRQRDPGDRSPEQAMDEAAAFFRDLAPAYEREGTMLAFEANAALYDCRFVTHTRQAIELVRRVDHPGFRMQLDLGTLTINEEPAEVIAEAVPCAAHVHVSEPRLAPVGSTGADHRGYGRALAAAGWSGWISIEMGAAPDWARAMTDARDVLAASYEQPFTAA
jgi:sugar phosphate isomerase/epimerase